MTVLFEDADAVDRVALRVVGAADEADGLALVELGDDAGQDAQQLEMEAAGIRPGTVRLWVQTESVDDLIWDLEQGLACVR